MERIRDTEYCDGCGEAPACGVFCMATRERRRSSGGCGEAPVRCVFAVVKARQPARGPDSMVFTLSDGVCWGSGTTATGPASRWPSRRGAVYFFRLLIDARPRFDGDFLGRRRLVVVPTWIIRPPWLCSFECSLVLMPQSNRVRVEVWSSPRELSCGVPRVDVPIQPGESSFFSFLVFFLPMGLLGL